MTKTDADEAKSVMVALTREPELFTYLARSLADEGDTGAQLFDRLFAVTTDVRNSTIDAGPPRCSRPRHRDQRADHIPHGDSP